MAPAIAGVAVGMGVPILLAYIYGVVPVSLCQNGVCGVSASPLGVRIDFDDDDEVVGVGIVSGAAGVGNSGGTGVGSGSAGNGGGAGVGGGRGSDDLSAMDGNANDSGSIGGPTAYYSRGSAAGVGVGQNKRNTDAVSLDHATNLGLVGNPSIGNLSFYSSFFFHFYPARFLHLTAENVPDCVLQLLWIVFVVCFLNVPVFLKTRLKMNRVNVSNIIITFLLSSKSALSVCRHQLRIIRLSCFNLISCLIVV